MSTLANDLQMDEVIAGAARLSPEGAMRLYREATLHDLGRWATAMADRKMREAYPDAPSSGLRTYVIDRNINYTNVCSARCTFCAFRRDGDEADAYTLSTEQLHRKIAELVAIGGTQILLQGGMHPDLPIEFYEEMLRGIKAAFPTVHVHGFSPPEFVEFVAVFKLEGFAVTAPGESHTLAPEAWSAKLEAIMRRLMAAGLDSIPGGGGEIFAEPVRRRIGLGKATATQWLDVMSTAHRLGMKTSATMMFGHVESVADRIDHMRRVRDRQDEALAAGWPGRYVSFIAWPFQRENTPMGRLPDWLPDVEPVFPGEDPSHRLHGKMLRMAGATEYLRMQAIARLFFDNVHSIGSSWVTMGPKIGQLALFHGATDMGSVMMEENVVSAAGTTYCLTEELICHLIRGAGYIPAQRDNSYRILQVHCNEGPDTRVTDWTTQRVKKLHIEQAVEATGANDPIQLTVTR
jgi:cyclic dehypoxanthinyl futalosine synthase